MCLENKTPDDIANKEVYAGVEKLAEAMSKQTNSLFISLFSSFSPLLSSLMLFHIFHS
jgi:hypothetical protein